MVLRVANLPLYRLVFDVRLRAPNSVRFFTATLYRVGGEGIVFRRRGVSVLYGLLKRHNFSHELFSSRVGLGIFRILTVFTLDKMIYDP